ncbi:DUF6248 family natural product biosynthesis protein [Streptomonospora arabica]|uniref:DUF6248 family natural product biosynthesis protein n=1 Tax=Streptomonospora arabica TaxID=412417 RepID=A0ABV9SSK5_9ACTN
MTPEEAAWVREHAWMGQLQREYAALPGVTHTCTCQFGPTGHCGVGQHDQCQSTAWEPKPETYVTDGKGSVRYFADPREPARVWLAPTACGWLCPCGCHRPAVADWAPTRIEQPALF